MRINELKNKLNDLEQKLNYLDAVLMLNEKS